MRNVCRAHNGRAVAHKYGFAGVRRAFKEQKNIDDMSIHGD
jgi:hypothetical protein